MVSTYKEVQSQWLAVLDGRFLPVSKMTFSIESDTKHLGPSNSMVKGRTTKSGEIMNGKFNTRREPRLKRQPDQLRLYESNKEYLIWNMRTRTSKEKIGYSVEWGAKNWTIKKR